MPATFYVIDEGLENLVFGPNNNKYSNDSQRICTEELHSVALRLRSAHAAWVKGRQNGDRGFTWE